MKLFNAMFYNSGKFYMAITLRFNKFSVNFFVEFKTLPIIS